MEIKFEKVTLLKNRGCSKKNAILKNISFDIFTSGIYGFVGNSNCGKSGICELISFLNKPNLGRVKVGKYSSVSHMRNLNKLRFDVGYLYSDPFDMFVTTTVKKELLFGLKYFKYKYKTKNKRIIDSLKLVGLDESYLDKKLSTLSLSEARKVALASILTFNPKILLLDAPTIGISTKDKNDLIRLLKTLKNKYNKIVLIMTKDTDFIYSCSDYIFLMNEGEIVKRGRKDIMHDVKMLRDMNLMPPRIVTFVDEARKKGINLKYYDNVKDLAKGVYRDAC